MVAMLFSIATFHYEISDFLKMLTNYMIFILKSVTSR